MDTKFNFSFTDDPEQIMETMQFARAKENCRVRNRIIIQNWGNLSCCATRVRYKFNLPISDQDDILGGALDGLFAAIASFDIRKGSVRFWANKLMYQHAIEVAMKIKRHRDHEVSLCQFLSAGEYTENDILDKHGQDHEEAILNRVAHDLDAALRSLDTKYRVVILLHDYEGLSVSEVAEELCIPQGTVKTRLRNAHLRLRAIIPQPSK